MALRPYQERGLVEARAAYRNGKRSVLLVLPTGGGKTAMGAEFVRKFTERGKRTVWFAHRGELVGQAYERLVSEGCDVGVISAAFPERARPHAPVQVASIDTARARCKSSLVAEDGTVMIDGSRLPPADLLVWDEAHHVVSNTYRLIAHAAPYRNAFHIGLTATPQRLDNKPLGDVYDSLVEVSTVAELTRLGHLVPCRVITTREEDGYLKGDFARDPFDAFVQYGANRPTIIFCNNVPNGKALNDRIVAAGYKSAWVDGTTHPTARRNAIEAFRMGGIHCLVNCNVLTEGFDAPRAQVCITARGCNSEALSIQMVGRVLRPFIGPDGKPLPDPLTGEVKTYGLWVDLSGILWRHGAPWHVREHSLAGGIKRKREARTFRRCEAPECSATWEPAVDGPACPLCGLAPSKLTPRSKDILDLDMQEVEAAADLIFTSEENRKKYYLDRVRECRAKGHKIGKAAHMYRAKFRDWPPRSWTQLA